MIKTTAQKIYIALIFIFMYAPIATLVVLSFNASKTRAKWGGFTTKWYTRLFSNSEIMQALYNTLLIALLSAVFATLIGTIAALSIQGMKKKEPCCVDEHHQYPNVECRDRNRYFSDASVFNL